MHEGVNKCKCTIGVAVGEGLCDVGVGDLCGMCVQEGAFVTVQV